MNSLLGRLGSFTVRRRWYVIGAWVVLLAVMASFASGLQDRLGSGGFDLRVMGVGSPNPVENQAHAS